MNKEITISVDSGQTGHLSGQIMGSGHDGFREGIVPEGIKVIKGITEEKMEVMGIEKEGNKGQRNLGVDRLHERREGVVFGKVGKYKNPLIWEHDR